MNLFASIFAVGLTRFWRKAASVHPTGWLPDGYWRWIKAEVEPMFFLLRCVFWLGIVFSAMFWTQNDPKSGGAGAHEIAAWGLRHSLIEGESLALSDFGTGVQGLAGVGEKVQLFCMKSPATCLAAVEKMQQIVTQKPVFEPQPATSDAADAAPPVGGSTAGSEVPRPPRRPEKLEHRT